MSKGKYIVLGFLVGGTISATTALLTTPTSGREVRSKIKEQSNELITVLEDLVQDGIRLKDQIAKTSKEGVVAITELTEDIKGAVEDWKESIGPNQANIEKYLEQIETSIKELEEKVSSSTDNNSEA